MKPFTCRFPWRLGLGVLLLAGCAKIGSNAPPSPSPVEPAFPVSVKGPGTGTGSNTKIVPETQGLPELEFQIPDEGRMMSYAEQRPIFFVSASDEKWKSLKNFWNEVSDGNLTDPVTGQPVKKYVQIKLPLGLTHPPDRPADNLPTVERWILGKALFFDPVLSSNRKVSCATCHDPEASFIDSRRDPVSTGIDDKQGDRNSPTSINNAYLMHQFWDGRASSLEEQAQIPVASSKVMWDGKGHAWNEAVRRVRESDFYRTGFLKAFGTEPTRDTIAKALATYERTILGGNSLHDRAMVEAQLRVEKEKGTFDPLKSVKGADYEKALTDSIKGLESDKKDQKALALFDEFDGNKDPFTKLAEAKNVQRVKDLAERIDRGRVLFFGRARCSKCHTDANFTDNQFHNLGVGVKDGQVPEDQRGRFAALPPGRKQVAAIGTFRTPTLRALADTHPYMHDGQTRTLEEVIDLYDRGGNVNEFLDEKLRDRPTEKLYEQLYASLPANWRESARGNHQDVLERINLLQAAGLALGSVAGAVATPALAEAESFVLAGRPLAAIKAAPAVPEIWAFHGKFVIPQRLSLAAAEKQDLLLFLKALHGDPIDDMIRSREKGMPPGSVPGPGPGSSPIPGE
jgi:cytochrome c peroxidase